MTKKELIREKAMVETKESYETEILKDLENKTLFWQFEIQCEREFLRIRVYSHQLKEALTIKEMREQYAENLKDPNGVLEFLTATNYVQLIPVRSILHLEITEVKFGPMPEIKPSWWERLKKR